MERYARDRKARFSFERHRPFASTDRKENHGHRQESCEEARRKEARCEKAGREKAGREKVRRQESSREEGSREEGRREEARVEAQAQRRVHEGDDALVDARRG